MKLITLFTCILLLSCKSENNSGLSEDGNNTNSTVEADNSGTKDLRVLGKFQEYEVNLKKNEEYEIKITTDKALAASELKFLAIEKKSGSYLVVPYTKLYDLDPKDGPEARILTTRMSLNSRSYYNFIVPASFKVELRKIIVPDLTFPGSIGSNPYRN